MRARLPAWEKRSLERCRVHYEVEKELAARLRLSTREQRKQLYSTVYDELFGRVPDHPLLTRKTTQEDRTAKLRRRIRLLEPYLRPDAVFLEIGAGDCHVSLEVARRVDAVCAIEVSEGIVSGVSPPANMQIVISNGVSVPVPDRSISVALSDQLMEHLHPDDALAQLREVFRVLRDGGVYICITPNRLSGPHDVSGYFEDVATGFHLKEYTFSELSDLFCRAGFETARGRLRVGDFYLNTPPLLHRCVESALAPLPPRVRRRLAGTLPLRGILGLQTVARKALG